jgi:hypothetical protein
MRIYYIGQQGKVHGHIADPGKLLSELASIYIYFGSHVLLIKSISDLCGVCH